MALLDRTLAASNSTMEELYKSDDSEKIDRVGLENETGDYMGAVRALLPGVSGAGGAGFRAGRAADTRAELLRLPRAGKAEEWLASGRP